MNEYINHDTNEIIVKLGLINVNNIITFINI